jgi:hypothetical protein
VVHGRSSRAAVSPGERLATPTGRGTFSLARYTTDNVVLRPMGQQGAVVADSTPSRLNRRP